MQIIRLPLPERKARDGLIRLIPSRSPGELLTDTVALLRREANLRDLAHKPDRYLIDLSKWIERQIP